MKLSQAATVVPIWDGWIAILQFLVILVFFYGCIALTIELLTPVYRRIRFEVRDRKRRRRLRAQFRAKYRPASGRPR